MRHVTEARRIDPIERAHLRDAAGYSPPVYRFSPSPDLADVVRRYWLPVWSLPDGVRTEQRVLQYPVCLIVVANSYARLVGPTTGLATRELAGSGWACGTMLQPAVGATLLGETVRSLTDQFVPLDAVQRLDGAGLIAEIRALLDEDPTEPARQLAAVAVLERALAGLLPVDEEGLLVNGIVEFIETDSTVRRVGDVCQKFDLSERSLQRLTARRIGLPPKWLIQRRRLHEAAEALQTVDPPDLARVAAELGYADQAHFTRDFRTVTGLTPGEYAAERRG